MKKKIKLWKVRMSFLFWDCAYFVFGNERWDYIRKESLKYYRIIEFSINKSK